MYQYSVKFEIGHHYFEKSSQSVASEIRRFCSISMQIGHYKTYATMIKNEISKNCQDFWINPAEVTTVVRVLPRDLRINDRLIVGLVLDITLYRAVVYSDSCFPRL